MPYSVVRLLLLSDIVTDNVCPGKPMNVADN